MTRSLELANAPLLNFQVIEIKTTGSDVKKQLQRMKKALRRRRAPQMSRDLPSKPNNLRKTGSKGKCDNE